MASEFSHAIVALTTGKVIQSRLLTGRALLLGVVCSIIPDADVIGFHYGIHYGDVWGHRGLTHSVLFAALLSGFLVAVCYRRKPSMAMAGMFLYFFVCTASHGILDAMTDGGLGVAFFSPFDTARYFFSHRPIVVSPIGIGEFFTEGGMYVLVSEAMWIWFPSCAVVMILCAVHRLWSNRSQAGQELLD